MKRSEPLRRKTPLKRTSSLRSGGRLKSTPINPLSDRKRAELRRRREIAADMERKAGVPVTCQAAVEGVCRFLADDLHEPLTRSRGGDPCDEDGVVPVCRPCHRWIHDHPQKATALGLLEHSWDG